MTQRRVTIQDVARLAGVSITTVSRYLNQHYDAMSDDTKNRIRDVIADLNYQPNALARGLKSNQSRMIAVVVVNISYPYCVSLIQTLSNSLSPVGYNVHVCETGGDARRETQILTNITSKQADALIIQTNGDNNELLAEIAGHMPVVLVDRQFDIPGTSCIVTNNHDASYQITDYLFKEGYSEILYVTEVEEHISTRIERKSGYIEACRNHGKAPWVEFVDRQNPQTFAELASSLEERRHQEPFAIYTANGLLLMQLYRNLRGLLRKVKQPVQIGIATFDEPEWVSLVNPSMTCVRQPVEQIGEWAAKAVVTRIKKGEAQMRTRKVRVLPSSLVIGDSTRLLPVPEQAD
jgi:LacI family transcriptional regulator, kdg operon repressor